MTSVEEATTDTAISPMDRLIPSLPLPEEDPLENGLLMQHQKEWLEDDSTLKLCAKGRRTGITFAEALDDTLTAASRREAGGDNVFYIGDTKAKGREFVDVVAHFARVVAKEVVDVEEFLFEDQDEDGNVKEIPAFRAAFASGYRVEALSSRPENIRGLQGIVVIDEAAFHKNVRDVLDAVNALLIWGGKVRIISTHNGHQNPFNELILEARAGKNTFNIHTITFDDAVANGLYERVCYVRDKKVTPKGKAEWLTIVRSSYGTRKAQMRQELDVIPMEGEGVYLSRALLEACARPEIPVVRWVVPDRLNQASDFERRAAVEQWCSANVLSALKRLDPNLRTAFGEDFARSGDLTCVWPVQIAKNLTKITPFVVELRNCPFEMQKMALFWIVRKLPKFTYGAMDATGNGSYLAEETQREFGADRIEAIHMSLDWYRTNMPVYRTGFEDREMTIPKDEDVITDHQAIVYQDGVARVPADIKNKGTDGYDRHGDTAIAGALAFYAARQDVAPIEFYSTGDGRVSDAVASGRQAPIDMDTGFGVLPGGTDMTGY